LRYGAEVALANSSSTARCSTVIANGSAVITGTRRQPTHSSYISDGLRESGSRGKLLLFALDASAAFERPTKDLLSSRN
jgi:hypothetical protein